MNKSLLSLTLGISTAVVLTACGGSGGKSELPNAAPSVSAVVVNDLNGGALYTRDELSVTYQYDDKEGDLESTTIVRWLIDGVQVATGPNYITALSDAGKSVVIEVEPIAKTGTANGAVVKSRSITAKARNFILFEAQDAEGKRRTWTTDGTAAGTEAIANFNSKEVGAELNTAIDFNGKKILSINSDGKRQMAVTDGTSEGTIIFDDNGLAELNPRHFEKFNDKIYFNGYDGANGYELWSTDGSQEGTSLVKNIAPGYLSGNQPHSGGPSNLTALNDTLYFAAYTAFEGPELWSSKGTAGETQLLVDLNAGSYGSSPTELNVLGDKLIYTAEYNSFAGRGVYVYNQSTRTNLKLSKAYLDRAHNFVTYNEKAFFVSGAGRRGWLSDGTSTGTKSLTMPASNPTVFQSIVFNNSLYIVASSKLYKLNNDTSTFEIAHASLSSVSSVQEYKGALFMSAASADVENTGVELFRFDGSVVTLIRNISEGSDGSNPYDFHVLNDHMIFTAENDEKGKELWITDGTMVGTHLLIDINDDSASSNPSFCYITNCR